MRSTVNQNDFLEAFKAIRPDNFSYHGLIALYGHLIDMEDDIREEFELDVIAFCCEYSEYENVDEAYETYFGDDYMPESRKLEKLQENTMIIQFDGGIIVQDF